METKIEERLRELRVAGVVLIPDFELSRYLGISLSSLRELNLPKKGENFILEEGFLYAK